jgi:hypothetical protein
VTVQEDERAGSRSDLVWTIVTVVLWVIAVALAVWVVATTLFD